MLAPDRFRGFPYRTRLLAETLPLDPSMIVAELGCGPAFIAEALAPRVRRLVGFDVARATVEELSRQGLPDNLDIVAANLCDTESLIGFAGAFDLLYSADTLEHVDDPAAFFATVALVLKPAGVGVVLFPNERPARRHGETSFRSAAELREALGPRLELVLAADVSRTPWARLLYVWSWKKPLSLAKRLAGLKPSKAHPQSFDETVAGRYGFAHRRSHALLNAYGRLLAAASGRRGGFKLEAIRLDYGEPEILDRYLWLELRKRGDEE